MNETIKEHSWVPLIIVALASFIIALDATFMNVSISQVVADLNTDVSTIQMIMSFYTLITAAFMLETIFNRYCTLWCRYIYCSNKFKRYNVIYRMVSN